MRLPINAKLCKKALKVDYYNFLLDDSGLLVNSLHFLESLRLRKLTENKYSPKELHKLMEDLSIGFEDE